MDEHQKIFAKVARRIIPLMVALYTVSFLDRVNVGFAALTMNKDLGFSPEVFGWGAGVFFFGYFLFEVPSNVILAHVGARTWICRIMATWGVISAAFAFVQGPMSFYVLRFLLGLAEAGFAPGMIFYLSLWFPANVHAKYGASYFLAVPLTNVIGAPLWTAILEMDGIAGLHGCQWLFIVEAAPALFLAATVFFFLPSTPSEARWLSPKEREIIAATLAAERGPTPIASAI
jgi:ACS family tartrate transporter-like MFS transporter